uniref:Uncharacterized protein n=1 Tax=Tanacetum cinerariifolium TaxID=118510 RepID=A0A6L2M3X4_TANCI|nr:hypothetical protein [Tanacetum cinerariifolium]
MSPAKCVPWYRILELLPPSGGRLVNGVEFEHPVLFLQPSPCCPEGHEQLCETVVSEPAESNIIFIHHSRSKTCGFFLKGRDYDAKRERLETVNNKTPNRWLTKEKADSNEEDVDLKRKRPASQRRTLRRRKRGGRERTIRGTTIEQETFREDHKIGGSRQRFEMPFKVTGLSNHGQSLGSEIFCKLADEDVSMAIKKKK